jgi:dihydrofolate synthase/folylpolyglutamate synthase
VVLVAGTNGKGSTAALLATVLQAAGHRTGLFVSPHLLQFRERVRIGSELLTHEEAVTLFDAIRAIEHRCPARPSFFECTTAMAAMHFSRRQVDVAVFEVGLGGRLDATNVIDRELAVITPVALDHQKLLGGTLAQIAGEKAAILPANGTAVIAPQAPTALTVIERAARDRNTRLLPAPPAVGWEGGLALGDGTVVPAAEHPSYQWTNVATAVSAARALDRLGVAVSADAIDRAVADFAWPGRYQWVGDGLVVDGAHNPAAISALLAALSQDRRSRGRPLHCVFSALRDKAAAAMADALRDRAATFHLCPLRSRRRRDDAELRALAPEAPVHPTVADALAAAGKAARSDGGLVLVTGSLMLAGEALALATGAERDPPVDG